MKNNKVIFTKTPLRVSLCGGGTDMPYFYNQFNGSTISFAIKFYVYVIIKLNNNYKYNYRLNYSTTENVNSISKIKNLRIRKVLEKFKIKKPLYISTFADIPAGSGLGSSSSFTVGLINAVSKFEGIKMSKYKIAELAYEIESKISTNSLGKQDHFIASYGGSKKIYYSKNKISVKSIKLNKIISNVFLYVLGWNRSSRKVLNDQKKNLNKNIHNLKELNKITNLLNLEISKKNLNLKKIGKIIEKSWILKKTFSKYITNKKIDYIYSRIISKGAYGGKLLGAGQTGFLMFLSSKKIYRKIKKIYKEKVFKLSEEIKGTMFF